MKTINIILTLMMGSFVFVNLNDPDPFLWVTIYGIVGVISFLRAFGRFNKNLAFILMILIGIYALVYIPYFYQWLNSNNKAELFGEMIYDTPYIEGTREFGGLLIADLILVYNLYIVKK